MNSNLRVYCIFSIMLWLEVLQGFSDYNLPQIHSNSLIMIQYESRGSRSFIRVEDTFILMKKQMASVEAKKYPFSWTENVVFFFFFIFFSLYLTENFKFPRD